MSFSDVFSQEMKRGPVGDFGGISSRATGRLRLSIGAAGAPPPPQCCNPVSLHDQVLLHSTSAGTAKERTRTFRDTFFKKVCHFHMSWFFLQMVKSDALVQAVESLSGGYTVHWLL